MIPKLIQKPQPSRQIQTNTDTTSCRCYYKKFIVENWKLKWQQSSFTLHNPIFCFSDHGNYYETISGENKLRFLFIKKNCTIMHCILYLFKCIMDIKFYEEHLNKCKETQLLQLLPWILSKWNKSTSFTGSINCT